MNTINSIKHEKIVLARSVKTQKGRRQNKKMLLEGEQIIDWALERGIILDYLMYTESERDIVESKYLPKGIPAYQVSNGIQKKVTDRNYVTPILGVGNSPDTQEMSQSNFIVVLDDIQDFGNMGSIIRTCQAFGITNIISTSNINDLYNRKTIDASRGTVFSTDFFQFDGSVKTIDYLHEHDYQIVVTSPRGDQLQSLIELEPRPVALIIGNETNGISTAFEENADFLIQIPMTDSVESLNVGVATGISIYELQLKQVLTMIEQQIKTSLGREMNVASMLVQRALDVELKKVSALNSQQVIFLMVLKCDKEMTIENMCRQFGVLEKEVELFLGPLSEQGLVTHDKELRLTLKGEETIGKLWRTIEKVENNILSTFSEDETEHFIQQLQTIQSNCIRVFSSDDE